MNPSEQKPPFTATGALNNDLAAEIIREKIKNLYGKTPSKSPAHHNRPKAEGELSPHQKFRQELNNSGKSLADIQTAWYQYYVNLPDYQKHEVWQEFYAGNKPKADENQQAKPTSRKSKGRGSQTVSQVKNQLLSQIDAQSRLKAKHHIQSILFGLAMGSVVLLIMLFGFFNERIIAPFITPSRTVSNTPIIAGAADSVGPNPEVIIPKINVEIPVVYGMKTIDENAVENALMQGVVHYATTPEPGQHGNAVFFGHSSNNILNKGKYKFAFVLLHELKVGDTFMLTKDGVRYTYQVYDRKIVNPNDVSVLGAATKADSATLITCDPPGTSLHRLVVTGKQISPDPTANKASTAIKSTQTPTTIPSNSETLWHRLTSWL